MVAELALNPGRLALHPIHIPRQLTRSQPLTQGEHMLEGWPYLPILATRHWEATRRPMKSYTLSLSLAEQAGSPRVSAGTCFEPATVLLCPVAEPPLDVHSGSLYGLM